MDFGELAPAGGDFYKTAAMHPLFMVTVARDEAISDAEEFCAKKGKTSSIRDTEIYRDPHGVYVHVWFKCEEI